YEALVEKRKQKEKLKQQTSSTLQQRTKELQEAQKSKFIKLADPKNIKQMIRTTGAYILGRRNRKNIYSKTYKRKDAANQLKGYTTALYEKGFTEKALEDLQYKFDTTTNRYLKRAIAWELGLWFANQQTKSGALQALSYLAIAEKGEQSLDIQ